MYDVGDRFSGDSDFGYVRSILSNSEFRVKTEKVESVADMSMRVFSIESSTPHCCVRVLESGHAAARHVVASFA